MYKKEGESAGSDVEGLIDKHGKLEDQVYGIPEISESAAEAEALIKVDNKMEVAKKSAKLNDISLPNSEIASLGLSPEDELAYREIRTLLQTSKPKADEKRVEGVIQEKNEQLQEELEKREGKELEGEINRAWEEELVPLYEKFASAIGEKISMAKWLNKLDYGKKLKLNAESMDFIINSQVMVKAAQAWNKLLGRDLDSWDDSGSLMTVNFFKNNKELKKLIVSKFMKKPYSEAKVVWADFVKDVTDKTNKLVDQAITKELKS